MKVEVELNDLLNILHYNTTFGARAIVDDVANIIKKLEISDTNILNFLKEYYPDDIEDREWYLNDLRERVKK
jgi:hypothetical protein